MTGISWNLSHTLWDMELQFFSLATTFSLDRFVWYYIILQYDALYNDGVVWCIQWNLSNPDTNGAGESVIVSEVSSFQRLKCITWGGKRCPV